MAILVLSSSKRRIAALKHARHCVIAAISRIPAKDKASLSWVLVYIFLFLSSFLVADFLPQDGLPLEPKRKTAALHYLRVRQGWICG